MHPLEHLSPQRTIESTITSTRTTFNSSRKTPAPRVASTILTTLERPVASTNAAMSASGTRKYSALQSGVMRSANHVPSSPATRSNARTGSYVMTRTSRAKTKPVTSPASRASSWRNACACRITTTEPTTSAAASVHRITRSKTRETLPGTSGTVASAALTGQASAPATASRRRREVRSSSRPPTTSAMASAT